MFSGEEKIMTTPSPFALLTEQLKEDPEYAWSWHCNIAMGIFDRVDNQISHRKSNEIAASMMKSFFDIDITTNPSYETTVPNWNDTQQCDMLVELYDKQMILNASVTPWATPEAIKNSTEEEKMRSVSRYLDVLFVEVAEAKLAAGCRWWRVSKDTSGGMDHLTEELIDCLHFLLSSFIVLGIGPRDIRNRYIEKNQKNHVRPDWERENNKQP